MATPSVSAVVLSYRHPSALSTAIETLLAQDSPPGEILVVDQGTPGEALGPLRRRFPQATWIPTGANLGYTGGMNAGLARCRGDLILFLCDDCRLEPDFLRKLAEPFSDPAVGLASGVHDSGAYAGGDIHLSPWPRLEIWTGPRGTAPYETAYATGAAFLARRSLMQGLGGLAPAFFMYWEDVDLSLRVRRAGARILCVPAARFSTAPEGRDSLPADRRAVAFHKAKNTFLIMARHCPRGAWPGFLARFYGPHLWGTLWNGPFRLPALRGILWPLVHPGSWGKGAL